MKEDHFRVEVDGRTFEIDTTGGKVKVDGQPVDASVTHVNGTTYAILVDGRSHEFTLELNGLTAEITGIAGKQEVVVYDHIALLLKKAESDSKPHTTEVRAPMPGLVLKIEVEEGQDVQKGSGLLVLEAMKMENEIFSSGDAVVETIHVGEGQPVAKGQLLVTLG